MRLSFSVNRMAVTRNRQLMFLIYSIQFSTCFNKTSIESCQTPDYIDQTYVLIYYGYKLSETFEVVHIGFIFFSIVKNTPGM